MSGRYVVILDNNMVEEPLAVGLPYWTFEISHLPSRETAWSFVEDVLFQSELWANEGKGDEWTTLRLVGCRSMCARCGRLLVASAGSENAPFHVVWYIAENRDADVLSAAAFANAALWYDEYLAHQCDENFFDAD